jgi:hypothetical protein
MLKAKVHRQQAEIRGQKPEVRGQEPEGTRPRDRRLAAVDYLSRLLCVGFALALFVSGCAGPRPLKGGKAVTTRKPTGVIEQTLVQAGLARVDERTRKSSANCANSRE